MADRVDFYFRQRVTESELDLAFELLEKADRNLTSDLGIYGIISGAVPAPHSPVPNLTIDLTAPGRAYDKLGQRLFFGAGQTVDCAVDLVGIPTDVAAAGNERWLGIFLRFKRQLSDPRTDGNSQQVYFRRDEAFEVVVRQAPEAVAGAAPKPTLQPDELLLCDVRRRRGQTQLLITDIDTSRRQAFVFAQGASVAVATNAWNILAPPSPNVQASLDEVDAELREHFTAAARRHAAAAIDYAPHGFVASGNLQAALDEVIDDLTTSTAGSPGAARVGADAAAGAPNALPAGTVDGQLSSLLSFINAHAAAVASAHPASAIEATGHNHISAATVQEQLQEIVADLLATGASAPGAGLVGIDAIAGAPVAIAAGTVRTALATVLGGLNAHAGQELGVHPASAISVASAEGRLGVEDVEAAFDEILGAYEMDHFRGNQSGGGQHRTIHQPNLGGTKALLWDSLGNGGPSARLRVYADVDSIWFTVNAAWNAAGNAWVKDNTTYFAGGFRFSRNEFEILQDATTNVGSFGSWGRTMRLPMGNSAFEATGSIRETGRCGVKLWNPLSIASFAVGGATTNFRCRFPSTPSSITLTMRVSSPTSGMTTSVDTITRDGFALTASHAAVPANSSGQWYGDYTAVY